MLLARNKKRNKICISFKLPLFSFLFKGIYLYWEKLRYDVCVCDFVNNALICEFRKRQTELLVCYTALQTLLVYLILKLVSVDFTKAFEGRWNKSYKRTAYLKKP